jgi:hypothetical protein
VSAPIDVLRAQLGRLSDLISVIEDDCDTTDTVCHGHDLTEDGKCALAADLIAIFHAMQGAVFAAPKPPAEVLPDFVRPIEQPGEIVEGDLLRLAPEVEKELRETLDEIDRARANAMAHAHEVWIR